MSEKELVENMYNKHQKWVLSMQEAATEWGSSYSFVSKLFTKNSPFSEKMILEKQIIPPWIQYGGRRMWKITDIATWLVNTEPMKGIKQ
ncbi:hypothetical protein [uncultured Sulfuricurvum sp.]|uniref:hypothetical protein n=1 Tax=uncultured Sulfuricurvum sp. TaxID=430693 RepID=UPI002638D58E|nr:hypothetical protein [uncultured Sulfuricurvum sp.]